ncbi:MAG TPA: acyltransferase family protein [Terriglobia bacterium]|nr:acyltransferase family protein [Terriglobia bacterium]
MHAACEVTPCATKRRYELDWLRALAVLVVFLYHSARFFNGQYWDIRNTGRNAWVDLGAGFVGLWLIPLFFLVSGAATRFTLERHLPGEYVRRRFRRLILPFIFGTLLLSPLQALLLSPSPRSLENGWLEFYADFFAARLHIAQWSLAWLFEGFGYHLWFLGFLFVFSVLSLPVFAALRNTGAGRNIIDWLAGRSDSFWKLLLWSVPLVIVQCALRAGFPEYLGPADFFFWLLFFLYGYLLYADPRILHAMVEQRRGILIVAVACFLALAIARYLGLVGVWQQHPSYSPGFLLFLVLWSLGAWTWLLYILSQGIRLLSFGNATIRYATAAVLPFYVFHQPAVMVVGLLVAGWNLNVTAGWVCVSALSMALTLGIYEGVIRRMRPTKVAFGMG